MTGLLKEIQADDHHNQRSCKLALILETLEKADRADLEAAIVGDYTASAIVRVLNRRGHEISLSVMSKHRRKECACVAR